MMSRSRQTCCCRQPKPGRWLAGSLIPAVVIGAGLVVPASVNAADPAAGEPAARLPETRPAGIPLSFEQNDASPAAADGDAAATTGFSGLPFDWQAWGVVLLAIAGMVGLRVAGRQRPAALPADVFELLGEAMLGSGQPVRVIRFGPKTLLVTSGSGGPRTLAELDDPLATEWIAAACRGDRTLRASTRHPAGSAGDDSATGSLMAASASSPRVVPPGSASRPPAEVA